MNTKILIIDDNEAILDATRSLLEYLGFTIDTSTDPKYLDSLATDLPDIILLDILLVNADGREVCKQIKLNKTIKHIPVILLSAQSDDEVREGAAACGAQGYILKPFKIETMIAVIKESLKEKNIPSSILHLPML
jgi:CheY-like chemotaxis protein